MTIPGEVQPSPTLAPSASISFYSPIRSRYSQVSLVISVGMIQDGVKVDGGEVLACRRARLGFVVDHRICDGKYIGSLLPGPCARWRRLRINFEKKTRTHRHSIQCSFDRYARYDIRIEHHFICKEYVPENCSRAVDPVRSAAGSHWLRLKRPFSNGTRLQFIAVLEPAREFVRRSPGMNNSMRTQPGPGRCGMFQLATSQSRDRL